MYAASTERKKTKLACGSLVSLIAIRIRDSQARHGLRKTYKWLLSKVGELCYTQSRLNFTIIDFP